MDLTSGKPDVFIGMIDGPVAVEHPALDGQEIREVSHMGSASCSRGRSRACMHGTFVAGVLSAARDSGAAAIAPLCPLLIRPVFHDHLGIGDTPSTSPAELAEAIWETVKAGARVINLSLTLTGVASITRELTQALDFAAASGTLVVVAAGNQAAVGSSVITRHPWVIPVTACDLRGVPLQESTCGNAIGSRGLRAPGVGIVSLEPAGVAAGLRGTSVAAPIVTGTIALLLSVFPTAGAAHIKRATIHATAMRRKSVVPPLLDAWTTYQVLASQFESRSSKRW